MDEIVHCNCESWCREQGIDYFHFNPQLDNGVDLGQIRTNALAALLCYQYYIIMGMIYIHVMRYFHK